MLDIPEGVHLTPIPVDDDLSSLSAILMKAKAYLDMVERKERGEKVEEKHIKKHKADVFRLSVTLAGDAIFELPKSIQLDMQAFANGVAAPSDCMAHFVLNDVYAPYWDKIDNFIGDGNEGDPGYYQRF